MRVPQDVSVDTQRRVGVSVAEPIQTDVCPMRPECMEWARPNGTKVEPLSSRFVPHPRRPAAWLMLAAGPDDSRGRLLGISVSLVEKSP